MHDNPAADWQSLAEHYRSMYDEELENLADDFGNLTETAQQVLRNELGSRGLPAPGEKPAAVARPESPAAQRWASNVDPDAAANRSEETGGSKEDERTEDDQPKEFTWKTLLCECETTDQAYQLREMLKRAGIDSWVETPSGRSSVSTPRVVVAADQLDEAIKVARRPIPQEIVDETKMEVPEYEPPKCPSCGDEDPTLESAEPTNSWLCEVCGKQWTEPAIDATGEPEKAGQ
jgi:ribosomal protein L37AE/L43A